MSCEIESQIISVERIIEYAELKQEAPHSVEASEVPVTWPDKGVIEFKNYSTRYREETDLILNDISFKAKAGEKIGIVGRTGGAYILNFFLLV